MTSTTRRNILRALHVLVCVFPVGLPIQTWTAAAQPVIRDARVILNTPTVELRWRSECVGVAVPVT